MAIKAMELRKALEEKRTALAKIEEKIAGFQKRSEELNEKIETAESEEVRNKVDAEIEEFNSEKESTETEAKNLREAVGQLEKDLEEAEQEQPSNVEEKREKEIKKMEKTIELRDTQKYMDAYANYIRTGKDTEVRALLTENAETNGQIPVPTIVDKTIRTAWDKEQLMAKVRKTTLKGNVKVGFEISATGAVVHKEGTDAPTEEELILGIVTMVPESIKKWITVSDEALDLNGEEFLKYVYAELAYQIAKKAADILVGLIVSAPTASTATAPGQAAIESAVEQDTIVTAVGELSDEAVNPTIIMNKASYSAFKGAQYDGNFNADIFEGLDVVFNNTLPPYSTAEAGATYAIVGDLDRGAQVNLPSGDTIKFTFDELSLAEKDLVKIVGRQYAGMGVVAPKAFCRIKKPSTH